MLKLCCYHQVVGVMLQTVDDANCPGEQVVAQDRSLVQLPAGVCVSGQTAFLSRSALVTVCDLVVCTHQQHSYTCSTVMQMCAIFLLPDMLDQSYSRTRASAAVEAVVHGHYG